MADVMDKLVSLCKRKGFVFQSSEIYGGLNGCWDYGPLGVELLRNIKDSWWRAMTFREDVEGLDSSILMHARVWEASGHVAGFTDPMVEDKKTNERYRLDQLLEENGIDVNGMGIEAMIEAAHQSDLKSPKGNELSEARQFNLMFKTFVGPLEDESAKIFLRPETAQGIFVNYLNVQSSMRQKLPFGIAQVGKAFRNEITTKNFLFRTREFEQMEMEFFCHPSESREWYQFWRDRRFKWYVDLGLSEERLILRDHEEAELAHYSVGTADVEYAFPFCEEGEYGELEGIAHRGDFDLRSHMEGKLVREGNELVVETDDDGKPKYPGSGKDLTYHDEEAKERFVPHVIEPAAGADRTVLAFICDAFDEEEITNEKGKTETRTVMRFHPRIAPVKVGVFPLLKNKPELVAKAMEVRALLQPYMTVFYDETGAIGRRYRRQDEVGTPFGVTIDFDTIGENGEENKDTVTLRERDSMEQRRVKIDDLLSLLLKEIM